MAALMIAAPKPMRTPMLPPSQSTSMGPRFRRPFCAPCVRGILEGCCFVDPVEPAVRFRDLAGSQQHRYEKQTGRGDQGERDEPLHDMMLPLPSDPAIEAFVTSPLGLPGCRRRAFGPGRRRLGYGRPA